MNLSIEEKIDLFCCICVCISKEKERYSVIKDMSDEEIQEFRAEFGIETELCKETMKNDLMRLERLKDKFKKEIK